MGRFATLESRFWPLVRAEVSVPWRRAALVVLVAGPAYGAVMGSYAFESPERVLMVAYSAIKMPLLVGGVSLLCLLPYYVMHLILGLRWAFGEGVRSIVTGQAALAVALASLAPVTRFVYFCGVGHAHAVLFNAAMFALAAGAGHAITLRGYRRLIEADRRNWITLWWWIALYAFVGIQAGWILRPFIGTPGKPVTFFREEPFSNAYVALFRLLGS